VIVDCFLRKSNTFRSVSSRSNASRRPAFWKLAYTFSGCAAGPLRDLLDTDVELGLRGVQPLRLGDPLEEQKPLHRPLRLRAQVLLDLRHALLGDPRLLAQDGLRVALDHGPGHVEGIGLQQEVEDAPRTTGLRLVGGVRSRSSRMRAFSASRVSKSPHLAGQASSSAGTSRTLRARRVTSTRSLSPRRASSGKSSGKVTSTRPSVRGRGSSPPPPTSGMACPSPRANS